MPCSLPWHVPCCPHIWSFAWASCVVFASELCSQCPLCCVLSYYFNGSCNTEKISHSSSPLPLLALGLHKQRVQLSLSSNKIQNCWAVFLCWLWYLGISAFLLECLPACLSSMCCAAQASCCATGKPDFTLGFHCLLIFCFLAAASFPSLLLHPASSPLTASCVDGELLSLWQVHRFYIQDQLFKLFPLIKRFKF